MNHVTSSFSCFSRVLPSSRVTQTCTHWWHLKWAKAPVFQTSWLFLFQLDTAKYIYAPKTRGDKGYITVKRSGTTDRFDNNLSSSDKNLLHLPGILHDANVAGNSCRLQKRNEICRDLTELGCDIASRKKKGPGRKWLSRISWHKFSKQTYKIVGMRIGHFQPCSQSFPKFKGKSPGNEVGTEIKSQLLGGNGQIFTKFQPHTNDTKIDTHLSCSKSENKGNQQYFLLGLVHAPEKQKLQRWLT